MANTTKKTATKEPCEIQQEMTAPAETETKEAPARAVKSKTIKLDDALRVVVQSNVHGGLIFINRRTGDKTEWDNFGDKQTLTMGDLRSMKGSQRAFFENNWIFVDSIDEEGYEDVTPEDVYKALLVTQYYKESLTPDNFGALFRMKPEEIKTRARRLSEDGRTNLIVAANDAIRNGTLDSLRSIRAIEEALNCELVTIEG